MISMAVAMPPPLHVEEATKPKALGCSAFWYPEVPPIGLNLNDDSPERFPFKTGYLPLCLTFSPLSLICMVGTGLSCGLGDGAGHKANTLGRRKHACRGALLITKAKCDGRANRSVNRIEAAIRGGKKSIQRSC